MFAKAFVFLVQCGDIDRAERLFSSIDKKTIAIYSAMFKGEFLLVDESLTDYLVTRIHFQGNA